MRAAWGGDAPDADLDGRPAVHEAGLLRLDCSKARSALRWQPMLGLDEALDWIAAWHKDVAAGADAREATLVQIARYAWRSDTGVSCAPRQRTFAAG
jgi:CDP-glucose 4,6-dehydratase